MSSCRGPEAADRERNSRYCEGPIPANAGTGKMTFSFWLSCKHCQEISSVQRWCVAPQRAASAPAKPSRRSMERAYSPWFLLLHANLGLRPRLLLARAFSALHADLNAVVRAEGPPPISLGGHRRLVPSCAFSALHADLNAVVRAEGPPPISLGGHRRLVPSCAFSALHADLNAVVRAEGPPPISLGGHRRLVPSCAFSALHADLNAVVRAEGPPHISLGRSPRNFRSG